MTKRHEALIPLTHDHHHALVQARALIGAAETESAERTRVAELFIHFYKRDTLRHFHEEEEILFPRLLEYVESAPPELIRILVEHVQIHGLVSRVEESLAGGEPDGALLKSLGELLRAHVRFEEGQLFPLIESVVPEADLKRIGLRR